MTESFRLGRIAGVRVGINWSVLVIFTLITVGLAAGRFPLLYEDLSPVAYAVAGLVAGIVFFGSLLAHELSHAIVARRNGVPVGGITLWLFGGVAKLEGDAPNPGADLRIAGVGPLMSFSLAVAFALLGGLISAMGAHDLVVGVFGWLALINLVLAVFNLIPAAPLDGGRILRAFLWWRRGDRVTAAVSAARAGRVFGWLLIGLGIAEVVVGAGLGGLWVALIGWFITAAARAEEQYAQMTVALAGVKVAHVMSAHPTVAPANTTVQRLLDEYVFPNRYSTFPLVDEFGAPEGLVTLNRVKALPPDRRDTTPVSEVATPASEVPQVAPDAPMADVVVEMSNSTDGRALVVSGGRVIGIVSPTDVMREMQAAEIRGTLGRRG